MSCVQSCVPPPPPPSTHTYIHTYSLEKVRDEIAIKLYPKRVILIRHAEVSLGMGTNPLCMYINFIYTH